MKSKWSIATESNMNTHAPFLKTPSSPGLWFRLQLDDDLMRAERENGERIERTVQSDNKGID
jgi:hypothetical protein